MLYQDWLAPTTTSKKYRTNGQSGGFCVFIYKFILEYLHIVFLNLINYDIRFWISVSCSIFYSSLNAFNYFMRTEIDIFVIANCLLRKEKQNQSLNKDYKNRYL